MKLNYENLQPTNQADNKKQSLLEKFGTVLNKDVLKYWEDILINFNFYQTGFQGVTPGPFCNCEFDLFSFCFGKMFINSTWKNKWTICLKKNSLNFGPNTQSHLTI